MKSNNYTVNFRKVQTFTYGNVTKKKHGEITQKEKEWILSEALDWEERMFKKHGIEQCDRFDDFTPRFKECDHFEFKRVTVTINYTVHGIQVIGTIKDRAKLREFLENKPERLPGFTPSDYGFQSNF